MNFGIEFVNDRDRTIAVFARCSWPEVLCKIFAVLDRIRTPGDSQPRAPRPHQAKHE
jgi:hypothetical protein